MPRRRLWLIVVALFLADLVALAVVVAAVGTPRNTFQFELAKGLVQAGVVVVLGGALSLLVDENRRQREAAEKRRDEERQEAEKERDRERQQAEKERDRERQAAEKKSDLERERRGYREELIKTTLGRATASYSAVKRARRLIRARAIIPLDDAASEGVIADHYDAQMVEINNAQLQFENLSRDVKTSASLFSDVAAVTTALDALETYLNDIIEEYEYKRRHFAGDPPQVELGRLPRLARFLAPDSPEFGAHVLANFRRVQRVLRLDLLTGPSDGSGERGRSTL